MPTFVALLRGINVGAHKRVAMADLRKAVEGAGFTDVSTHIQTGNVVLGSRKGSAAAVCREIETAVESELGLDVDVMVRTAAELARIAEGNPFLPQVKDESKLFVAFLKMKPGAAAKRALAELDVGREEAELDGTELFLHYPDGYGRSKLTGALLERTLGTPATVRNWKVTSKLAELASERA